MSRKTKFFPIIAISLVVLAILIFFVSKKYWNYAFAANVELNAEKDFLYIPSASNYEDVIEILSKSKYLLNIESFKFIAEYKKYNDKILPGKYELKNKMSNNDLVNLLRSGKQTPVQLSFISVRNLNILAGKVSKFIEADSLELVNMFFSKEICSKYGFNEQTFISIFIPNTYQFYWNTSAEDFIKRMSEEYKSFWNSNRKELAQNAGLSQSQVSTLASIIEEETQKNDEKSRMAGVYMNRLKRNMLLQADPTVKYALGDFQLKRILNKHLTVNSLYNTYLYPGLPPGPICVPSIASIDAVLNYENHKFLYFCAKDDFSGYHVFAENLNQHNLNAKKYHNALRYLQWQDSAVRKMDK